MKMEWTVLPGTMKHPAHDNITLFDDQNSSWLVLFHKSPPHTSSSTLSLELGSLTLLLSLF